MRRFDKKKNMGKANLLAEQRHLESKGIINEIGPKTAAKAFPALGNSTPQDSRQQRIINDAAKSLFSKYMNNENANFLMFTSQEEVNPSKFVLTNVSLTQGDVGFHFLRQGSSANSNMDNTLVFEYNLEKDYLSTEGMYELNPFTANFLVGAVNKIREVYFTHMKGDIPKKRSIGKDSNGNHEEQMIQDPDFNVKSKIKKQSFKMFEGESSDVYSTNIKEPSIRDIAHKIWSSLKSNGVELSLKHDGFSGERDYGDIHNGPSIVVNKDYNYIMIGLLRKDLLEQLMDKYQSNNITGKINSHEVNGKTKYSLTLQKD